MCLDCWMSAESARGDPLPDTHRANQRAHSASAEFPDSTGVLTPLSRIPGTGVSVRTIQALLGGPANNGIYHQSFSLQHLWLGRETNWLTQGFQGQIVAEFRGGGHELVLTKSLEPCPGVSGIDYHIRYGPPRFDLDRAWHLVPIQARFSDALFPETSGTRGLFEGHLSFGNAIRKAYLCHSQTRKLQPGDILAFYRTQERQGLIAIGIVEDTRVSRDPVAIARLVARRTVYSVQEICDLCSVREVLAIRFRQARILKPSKTADQLASARVFARPPQSIMSMAPEGVKWMISQFRE